MKRCNKKMDHWKVCYCVELQKWSYFILTFRLSLFFILNKWYTLYRPVSSDESKSARHPQILIRSTSIPSEPVGRHPDRPRQTRLFHLDADRWREEFVLPVDRPGYRRYYCCRVAATLPNRRSSTEIEIVKGKSCRISRELESCFVIVPWIN